MATLLDIEKLIVRSPAEIFGADIDAEERRLLALCHPDLHDNDPKAGELFKRIQALADQARHPVRIKGKRHEYGLGALLASGDAADVYHGTAEGHDYLLKASRVPDADALLLAEAESLATIHAKAADSSYRLYFPLLVETMPIRDKFPKRINTFVYDDGFYTLANVLDRHKQLDGRHLAWIFKRLLTAIGFAHRVGVVHGAVLPEHILISPADHGLRLIGWGQSVKSGQSVRVISAKHRGMYPAEVLAKKPATAETDIYMAAKCAAHLAGAGIPKQIATFLQSCLLEGQKMRPGDAWDLLEEFDELLRQLYGPPKFHVLSMTGA